MRRKHTSTERHHSTDLPYSRHCKPINALALDNSNVHAIVNMNMSDNMHICGNEQINGYTLNILMSHNRHFRKRRNPAS